MNLYNDIDPKVCEWTEALIEDGLIPPGVVECRDIREIRPDELDRFTQCHFFCGIGGWPLALRLAGWPDEREVWTGSCPCQSFSVAGKGKGLDDERGQLWFAFRWLIAQCRPAMVFGEQVASKAGRTWLSGVRVDLEALGYGVGASDLCAAGVSAPHIRQRLWWGAARVAHSPDDNRRRRVGGAKAGIGADGERGRGSAGDSPVGGLAHGGSEGPQGCDRPEDVELQGGAEPLRPVAEGGVPNHWHLTIWNHCRDGKARRVPAASSQPGLLPVVDGLPQGVDGGGDTCAGWPTASARDNHVAIDHNARGYGMQLSDVPVMIDPDIPLTADHDLFPLAPSMPGRVGLLKGAGNAIVPQVAAVFIRAFMEALDD